MPLFFCAMQIAPSDAKRIQSVHAVAVAVRFPSTEKSLLNANVIHEQAQVNKHR
jgi:hypothetical protein